MRPAYSLILVWGILVIDVIALGEEFVCPRADIRKATVLQRVSDCDVIEGDLSIAFERIPHNASFHRLREITGSLLLYDVDGLYSLSTLFPRLAVIRGHSLVYSYALVIRTTTLHDIALPSLQLIEDGGVRIENNPKLCHADLVRWTTLWNSSGPDSNSRHPIVLANNGHSQCPKNCPTKCPPFPDGHRGCWSEAFCQIACSPNCTIRGLTCHMSDPNRCCHTECVGGCHGDDARSCVTCRRVKHMSICMSQCPPEMMEYRQRRCVTVDQCLGVIGSHLSLSSKSMLPIELETGSHSDNYSLSTARSVSNAIYRHACVTQCPADHARNESGYCVPCGNQCSRKSCPELLIHDLRDLDALVGCYSAVAIYLSIQEGEPDFVNRLLEEAFSRLRVIEQSLRIVRSPVLTTLRVFDTLKSLGTMSGNTSHPVVLEISGNVNLREMWVPHVTHENFQGLHIRGPGTVRITQNRHLCPDHILQFFRLNSTRLTRSVTWLSDVEQDLIQLTNGDLAYCNWSTIQAEVSQVDASSVRVSWFKAHINSTTYEDEEPALMFLRYRQIPIGFTIIQNAETFAPNKWKMLPVTWANHQSSSISGYSSLLGNLSPATRYALYLEIRYPLRRTGALSKIFHFNTLPVNPTAPRYAWLEAINTSTLNLTWTNPRNPGGRIDSYLIWFRSMSWNPDDYAHFDACVQTLDGLTPGGSIQVSSSTSFRWDEKTKVGANGGDCSQCSRCPALHQVEQLYNFKNYPNRYASWPASVSRWTVDDRGEPLPVILVNSSSFKYDESFPPDHVGLIVYRVAGNAMNPSHVDQPSTEIGTEYAQLITSLDHFTTVIVELQACQGIRSIRPANDNCLTQPPWLAAHIDGQALNLTATERHCWSSFEAELCGPRMTITGRTEALVEADAISIDSVSYVSSGPGSVRIVWPAPPDPNGIISHYQIRYRLLPLTKGHFPFYMSLLDSNETMPLDRVVPVINQSKNDPITWLTKCISAFGRSEPFSSIPNMEDIHSQSTSLRAVRKHHLASVVLSDLFEGLYAIQLRAVSLAGASHWTVEGTFLVPDSKPGMGRNFWTGHQSWAMLAVPFFILVLLTLTTTLVIYHARRRYLRMTTWTSTNPDYWTIYEVDDWEMDRDDIDVLEWNHRLGHGSFGTVYRGLVRTLRTPARLCYADPTNVPVAIKTINTATTLFDRRDFISEACHMKQFQTYHLVRLLGLVSRPSLRRSNAGCRRRWADLCKRLHVRIGSFRKRGQRSLNKAQSNYNARSSALKRDYSCLGLLAHMRWSSHSGTHAGLSDLKKFSQGDLVKPRSTVGMTVFDVAPNSPLVIMELMSEGDLASYLRHLGDRGLGSVEPEQAYLWATQIADGMAYLASKHYVHRDLAARNCLVNATLVVKIGDFGLCRKVFDRNYYQKLGHGRLPIRWMAPESLESAYFTSQSDVWSYGVVLWEIATMASLPYRGLSHDEVVPYILAGNTLLTGGRPANCPELLEQLMLHCWAFNSHERPTFFDLCVLLAPRFGDAEFRMASFYTDDPAFESFRDNNFHLQVVTAELQTDDICHNGHSRSLTPQKLSNNRDILTQAPSYSGMNTDELAELVNLNESVSRSGPTQMRTILLSPDPASDAESITSATAQNKTHENST